jgi:iron complex outermembrane recepter protein
VRRVGHRGRPRLFIAWVVAVGAAAAPGTARALQPCGQHFAAESRQWLPPLDRLVSLHVGETSLRSALDHLSATSHIRFSYSSEFLELDRRVCGDFVNAHVGDVLQRFLDGAAVTPVAVGPDQVVLAPRRALPHSGKVAAPPRSAEALDRVVVTGSTTGTTERALTMSLDVVASREMQERDADNFSQALDGVVPGVWIWEQSPASLVSRYASIRGASSFGVNYPKVYIDGIEVANPLLLTQFNPEALERVEVIRGPQGAALSGADAVSGVINVVTRHDGVAPDEPRATLRTSAGVSRSAFSPLGVLVQDHALSLRTGSRLRSADLDLTVGSMGNFVADGNSRYLNLNGTTRLIGAHGSLTGLARFFDERAGTAPSPVLAAWFASHSQSTRRTYDDLQRPPGDSMESSGTPNPAGPQSVREYTLGTTGTLLAGSRWTHSVVLGIDGYRLTNVAFDNGPIPSATDSALRAARGGADRGTMRLSSVAQFGAPEATSARVTLTAEQSTLREATVADLGPMSSAGPARAVSWRNTTGLVAQTSLAIHNTWFLTSGLRLERNSGYTDEAQWTTLPVLGVAYVKDRGPVTVKLRAAYGKGIRPPQTPLHQMLWRGSGDDNGYPELQPETQSGIEVGTDILIGKTLSLKVTRFDQHASGLIQSVAVADPQSGTPTQGRHVWYQLQNMGQVANRGWEFQSAADLGRLSLSGALSLVDSRVQRIAAGYTGDLRPGDRMLEVPARITSLSASWRGTHWLTAWSVTRAANWINYDRLSLAQGLAAAQGGAGQFAGALLRSYWIDYSGVTRLRGSLSRDLLRGFSLVLTGDNLLGRQRGEPDNVTVVPGRTLSLGLRTRF